MCSFLWGSLIILHAQEPGGRSCGVSGPLLGLPPPLWAPLQLGPLTSPRRTAPCSGLFPRSLAGSQVKGESGREPPGAGVPPAPGGLPASLSPHSLSHSIRPKPSKRGLHGEEIECSKVSAALQGAGGEPPPRSPPGSPPPHSTATLPGRGGAHKNGDFWLQVALGPLTDTGSGREPSGWHLCLTPAHAFRLQWSTPAS